MIKKTIDYFKLNEFELLTISDNGNTKEENLILDAGLYIIFCENLTEYKEAIKEIDTPYNPKSFNIHEVLQLIDGRIAVILN